MPVSSDPAMVSGNVPVQEIDPTLFESRFLKKIRDLGEVWLTHIH